MSNFALGSGLEGFSSFMDVEAEATVKINAGDDDSASTTDVAETAAPEVEEEIATTEKSDEDIDTAADNVNQTMNYAFKLLDDYSQCVNFYHASRKHGVSAGLLEYANMSFGYESKCRALGLVVPAIEADEGGPSFGDKMKEKASQFGNNAKTVGSNIVAKLKEIGKRIVEFIRNLFRKIYDYFASQSRVVNGLIEAVRNAPKSLNMSAEAQQKLKEIMVYRPKAVINKLNVVINEFQNKQIIENVYKEMKDVNPNTISLNLDNNDKISYYNAYSTRIGVEEVLNAAKNALSKMDMLKKIESTCEAGIAENIKKMDAAKANNLDAGNAEEVKKTFENIKTYCTKFISGIPVLVKEAIQVARVYIDSAKNQEQDTMVGNNPVNNQSENEEEYRRAANSARRNESNGRFVPNTRV